MKKDKITRQEIWKENGINFTVMNGGGYVHYPKPGEPLTHQVNRSTADDEDELLLPTGMSFEDEDEEKQKHIQRNINETIEPLYPAGINPNSKQNDHARN